MSQDNFINQLEKFYQTKQGNLILHDLTKMIQPYLQNNMRQKILSVGYTEPYKIALDSSDAKSMELSLFMQEAKMIAESSLDMILLLHSLEFQVNNKLLLRQLWRILKSDGKLLLIVPNKFSLVKIAKVPHQKLLSCSELQELLLENLFAINSCFSCPLMPILTHKILPTAIIRLIEHLGSKYLKLFGMFWVVETQKLLSLKVKGDKENYLGAVHDSIITP